ncbi:unnamed protein product [Clonostachys rosea]|uniref:Zn(2)-C6 fungal-type domain-containing protein n=1 Tax=Bionectria ochroleuca TaxID=29856 RepID=A0ABY6U7F3_BIOOC|nr:unnamed protein product [Clonostachys rosea]
MQSDHYQALNYRRSYKACLACRQRKSRCELGRGWTPGAPCRRCQRQMKECIFPSERVGSKETTKEASLTSRPAAREAEENPSSIIVGVDRSPRQDGPNTQPSPTSGAGEGNVSNSVMRTMISSGNDALEALFEPVRQTHQVEQNTSWEHESSGDTLPLPMAATPHGSETSRRLKGPNSSSSVLEMWNACRFVKQGWFSAEEAVFLVDMFFKHLQKASPVLSNWYADHKNHYQLISSEPMLCCTILTISSGYHALPCAGGTMRGFFIHERLWAHVQHLLLRILLGQEKNSKGKTRTMGTVEALLLLTEWHPRSLAFPPPIDGWDSDLLVHWTEDCNMTPLKKTNESRGRWLEDVINPSKRTNHMSWMLISCAVSLAVELGIFEDLSMASERLEYHHEEQTGRQKHLQQLLYLYAEQIALQHGRQSILPQGAAHQVLRNSGSPAVCEGNRWFVHAWIDLTKLTRIMMETLYSSGPHTSRLLQNGRYMSLVDHFGPMLSSWKDKHLMGKVGGGEHSRLGSVHSAFADWHTDPGYFHNFLWIEYYSARLYCYSVGIQAVIERCASQTGNEISARFATETTYDVNNYQFVGEVVSCSSHVLTLATQLADQGILRHAPARVIVRIIAASIFLLKGLGIGVSATNLQESLELLQRTISALRSSSVDEMHLGVRYAALLEMHLTRLQNSFVMSVCPPGLEGALGSGAGASHMDEVISGARQDFDVNPEDWFSLPFEGAFTSTDMNDIQGFSNLDDNDLDFLWNLTFAPEERMS